MVLSGLGCSSYVVVKEPSVIEREVESLRTEKLPFTIVYGGAQIRNADRLIDATCFSHIMLGSAPNGTRQRLAPGAKAILWTGIAQGDKQSPWAMEKSPWANDINRFLPKWRRTLARYAELQGDPDNYPRADFIVLDIEADLQGKKIARLQEESLTIPESVKQVETADFVKNYKREMLVLSAKAVDFLKENISEENTKLSSYGDVPITRNWYGIPDWTWNQWKADLSLTNYMGLERPGVDNPFAEKLNVMTPSAYYFFPSGQNLAYLLFQLEANAVWTEKDIVLFVSPRFVGKNNYGQPLDRTLAEATAIFPFFSGAKGLWIWESSRDRLKTEDVTVLPAYQGFFKGLERLGNHKEFFEGNYQLHIPVSAHAAFTDKLPVWRGVIKNGRILIAAQNPYAKSDELTRLKVTYQSWERTITLTGKGVFLEDFKL